MSVGGSTCPVSPEAAAERLHGTYDRFGEVQALVVGGGFEMAIPYDKIGRRPDVG